MRCRVNVLIRFRFSVKRLAVDFSYIEGYGINFKFGRKGLEEVVFSYNV